MLSRPFSVAGKTVVVTGGAQGIGLEIATAFAKAGCSALYLLDLKAEDAARSFS